MKQLNHNLWHHLTMIVISEVNNVIWLSVGLVITVAGWAIYDLSPDIKFYKWALGLPLAIIGVCLFLFKIHEIILVIVRPKRLQAICIFCQKND